MAEKPIAVQQSQSTDNPSARIREVIFLIRKLMQAGEIYTKELNKKFNISAPQSACLLVLHEDGPLSISQIAARIMVKSSTLTGIIDRLEKKGLLKSHLDDPLPMRGGKSRRIYRITPPGSKALAEVRKLHDAMWAGAANFDRKRKISS